MANAQRAKIVLKDLGDPSLIKLQPETVRVISLGALVGAADGFVQRTNPKDGEVFEGMTGSFRVIPDDPEREVIESGVLFIPDAFHNKVAAQLRAIGLDEKGRLLQGATVEFAFQINVIRANNPQGYSWEFKPLMEFEGENPLDRLQALYKHNQLEGPKEVKRLASAKK